MSLSLSLKKVWRSLGTVKKSKRMKKVLCVVLVLLATVHLFGCSSDEGESNSGESSAEYGADGGLLVGCWTCTYDNKIISFTFENNGKGRGTFSPASDGLSEVDITFKFEDGVLTIISYPPGDDRNALAREEYDAKLEGGILLMRPLGNEGEYYKFHKAQ